MKKCLNINIFSRVTRVFGLALILMFFSSSLVYANNDQVYKRVIESKTIRCGYAQAVPFFMTDPNTHQQTGFLKELVEKIGQKLGLKIEWTTEVSWGDVTMAVNANRFDMFCMGVWPNSARVNLMTLSRPIMYSSIYLWSRADDTRFNDHYEKINRPEITVTGQEGDMTAEYLNAQYPEAKKQYISPIADFSEVFMDVITKKADLMVLNLSTVEDFLKNNPGKMKRVSGPPVAYFQHDFALPLGEYQLKNMIDTVLTDLINDGTIAALLKKYDVRGTNAPRPDVFISGSVQ